MDGAHPTVLTGQFMKNIFYLITEKKKKEKKNKEKKKQINIYLVLKITEKINKIKRYYFIQNNWFHFTFIYLYFNILKSISI